MLHVCTLLGLRRWITINTDVSRFLQSSRSGQTWLHPQALCRGALILTAAAAAAAADDDDDDYDDAANGIVSSDEVTTTSDHGSRKTSLRMQSTLAILFRRKMRNTFKSLQLPYGY